MAKSYDEDDLFKHTSMTFGEHLEELRASLFKAVISLAIGFCIGLYFAPDIVQLIQSPLETALKTYYSEEAIEYINARLPEDLRNDPAIEKMVLEDGLMPEEVFVAPGEMLVSCAEVSAGLCGVELPATAPRDGPKQAAAINRPGMTQGRPDSQSSCGGRCRTTNG